MRSAWGIGYRGAVLWFVLKKNGSFGYDRDVWWGDVLRFSTSEQAESYYFFLCAKDTVPLCERASVVKIKHWGTTVEVVDAMES